MSISKSLLSPCTVDIGDIKALHDAIFQALLEGTAGRRLETHHVAQALRSVADLFDVYRVTLSPTLGTAARPEAA
ncbi:MAG: hypothetical protein RDU30_09780 [Desulfovibrionaceae bacterium]|nr:hypothetical protein [Desulfovibrionaceae bacterium]